VLISLKSMLMVRGKEGRRKLTLELSAFPTFPPLLQPRRTRDGVLPLLSILPQESPSAHSKAPAATLFGLLQEIQRPLPRASPCFESTFRSASSPSLLPHLFALSLSPHPYLLDQKLIDMLPFAFFRMAVWREGEFSYSRTAGGR